MDENIFYPELTLETDDIIMELAIKKDYSKIRDSDKRKEEFIKDLHDFIDEFSQADESFMIILFMLQIMVLMLTPIIFMVLVIPNQLLHLILLMYITILFLQMVIMLFI